MNSPTPFLNEPYGAYLARGVPSPDAELTRVGPGTPCGEYLRRFWQPVAFARDLGDVPLRIKIMGEDLVVFRDKAGRVGVLQLHCTHRGTSLEYGLISERGIRCCYHGWVFDVDGRILETPGEPASSTLKNRLCQGAYPVREFGGLVFAYMGPPPEVPAFPLYDTFDLPGYTLMPAAKFQLPCNWLQVKDNSMDPVHTSFLHAISSGYQFTPAFGALAELDWEETPYGMMYIATRRLGDLVWVRVADFMAPNIHQFTREFEDATKEKASTRPVVIRWAVPIDDTHTWNMELAQVDPAWGLTPEEVARPGFGQSDDRRYDERQRHPADYDAQASQREIAVHALEHLASTDRGVIMLRKIVRDGIRAVAAGRDPRFLLRAPAAPIPTACQDTVLRIPQEAEPAADRRLLRETGRKIALGR
ncbi:MAG TPA: aromatic ring-hydroxylating dioxygenase subunit alpha [Candidatus Methylomirabilis sp.]|nr:aromatic ring-hydroxylating dioxygenase subunit alpha [Candidatus Methylomirabilis sp.]